MDRIERHYYLNQLIEKRDNGRVNDHWNRPHDLLLSFAIYTLYVGTWGYYPYNKNTKPDAIRGKQTELPEIFVPGTRR